MKVLWLAVLAVTAACAQDWEAGAAIGYGGYHNGSIISTAGTAEAGIRNRFVAGAVLGEQPFDFISGEIRYTYHDGDPFLSAGTRRANIQGQSHSFHYDVLIHVRPRQRRWSLFFAAGAGVKWYRITGPSTDPQPLAAIGSLVRHDQNEFLVSVGGGVRYNLNGHLRVRFDFRDYITPFPDRILAPSDGATARGILHQFTPMFGLSYLF